MSQLANVGRGRGRIGSPTDRLVSRSSSASGGRLPPHTIQSVDLRDDETLLGRRATDNVDDSRKRHPVGTRSPLGSNTVFMSRLWGRCPQTPGSDPCRRWPMGDVLLRTPLRLKPPSSAVLGCLVFDSFHDACPTALASYPPQRAPTTRPLAPDRLQAPCGSSENYSRASRIPADCPSANGHTFERLIHHPSENEPGGSRMVDGDQLTPRLES